MMSLLELKEPPDRSHILLPGPPGARKSTLSCQVVANGMAAGRPVALATTEWTVTDIVDLQLK